MTSDIGTWIGRATAAGAGLLTATYAPQTAVIAVTIAGTIMLCLIVWLALASTHAKTKTSKKAAYTTLRLILNFLRPPRHNRSN